MPNRKPFISIPPRLQQLEAARARARSTRPLPVVRPDLVDAHNTVLTRIRAAELAGDYRRARFLAIAARCVERAMPTTPEQPSPGALGRQLDRKLLRRRGGRA
jgi:hypothetical protein